MRRDPGEGAGAGQGLPGMRGMPGKRGKKGMQDAEGIEAVLAQRLPGTSEAIVRARARVAGLAPLDHAVLVRSPSTAMREAVVRALHELGGTADGPLVRIDAAGFEPARGVPRATAVHLADVERLSAAGRAFWADVLAGRVRPAPRRSPRILASAGPPRAADAAASCSSLYAQHGPTGHARPAGAGDLLAVLARFPIDVPPLRDRPEDVTPIAAAIVRRTAAAMARPRALEPAAAALVATRVWRGDVEELERVLERAVAFGTGPTIPAALVAELIDELDDGLEAIRRRRLEEEREALVEALRTTGGNISRAAARIGRSRGAVYRMMQKHGVTLGRER